MIWGRIPARNGGAWWADGVARPTPWATWGVPRRLHPIPSLWGLQGSHSHLCSPNPPPGLTARSPGLRTTGHCRAHGGAGRLRRPGCSWSRMRPPGPIRVGPTGTWDCDHLTLSWQRHMELTPSPGGTRAEEPGQGHAHLRGPASHPPGSSPHAKKLGPEVPACQAQRSLWTAAESRAERGLCPGLPGRGGAGLGPWHLWAALKQSRSLPAREQQVNTNRLPGPGCPKRCLGEAGPPHACTGQDGTPRCLAPKLAVP